MPALTLIVPLQDPGRGLDALVAALDGQTAAASTFEVVLVDAGSEDGSRARLERLATRRPHVTYVPLDRSAGLHDQVAEAVRRASGDLVGLVPPGERPTTDAVELLLAAGADGRAVVGRRISDGEGDGLPLEDGSSAPAAPAAGTPRLVAVPGAVLHEAADPAAVLLGPDADEVVAVGARACLAGTFRAPRTSLTDVMCTWREGALDVEAVVDSFAVGTSSGTGAEVSAWLVVARADGLQEQVLPAAHEPDGAGPGRVRARLALADLPDDGLFSLRLRVRLGRTDTTFPLLCPSPGPAVVDGRLVAALVDPGGLVLDVGATTTGVVGRVAPGDASVDRTARGSLLVLRCRNLHVTGDASVPASVLLGRFRLRAALECRDGEAQVACWASGLAGRSRISVQVGGPRPRRTGLDLVISETGEMSLVRTPKKRPAPGPSAPQPEDAGSTRLRQVRDRLPAAVLPGARRIARTGVGRRIRALVVRL